MSVVICPWCQSEIPRQEGEEPEKWCPICDNELDGYRTLRIGLGDEEENDEPGGAPEGEEDLAWVEDEALTEKNEALLLFEETVERLLDDQDAVPECPHCREYMVEAGERVVEAESFRPRVPEALGQAVLTAPFAMTVYVCPSCFSVQQVLAEHSRGEMARRLSQAAGRPPKGSKR